MSSFFDETRFICLRGYILNKITTFWIRGSPLTGRALNYISFVGRARMPMCVRVQTHKTGSVPSPVDKPKDMSCARIDVSCLLGLGTQPVEITGVVKGEGRNKKAITNERERLSSRQTDCDSTAIYCRCLAWNRRSKAIRPFGRADNTR